MFSLLAIAYRLKQNKFDSRPIKVVYPHNKSVNIQYLNMRASLFMLRGNFYPQVLYVTSHTINLIYGVTYFINIYYIHHLFTYFFYVVLIFVHIVTATGVASHILSITHNKIQIFINFISFKIFFICKLVFTNN